MVEPRVFVGWKWLYNIRSKVYMGVKILIWAGEKTIIGGEVLCMCITVYTGF
ncbi:MULTISPECIES: hypothetical protein [unclassified Clostridium]|uniref:hypothetical protein n=1 Tax=unclassified Clostridium TaxID=2614128 RepID=UPI0025BBB079|nr:MULTISPECIES: hypothetical protein [unclassified Clostridium]